MSHAVWHATIKEMPPDTWRGLVITPGGDQRELLYERGLWWLPDRSMYVYFTPVMWQEVKS